MLEVSFIIISETEVFGVSLLFLRIKRAAMANTLSASIITIMTIPMSLGHLLGRRHHLCAAGLCVQEERPTCLATEKVSSQQPRRGKNDQNLPWDIGIGGMEQRVLLWGR